MEECANDGALVSALDEIKNLNKEILKAFIFQGEKILAKDEYVTVEEANKTIEVFKDINSRSHSIEGLETITINGTQGRVNITHINDYYLTIITSKEADEETVYNLTHVFAPTIFRIMQNVKLQVTPHSSEPIKHTELDQEPVVEVSEPHVVKTPEPSEQNFPEEGFAEFTVDDINSLGIIAGSSDSVQLDVITAGHWSELYGENRIHSVVVKEAKTGIIVECKYEVSKDFKHDRRNLVLVPHPVQRKLQIKKGATVLIKPIIQQESPIAPRGDKSLERKVEEVKPEPLIRSESHFLPNSPICQLIVADFSGFGGLRGSNSARFDKALVHRWKEFYGEQEIEEVIITDTVLGKTQQCKFKIETDPKFEGKGLIQMPKSLQKALEVKEGSLVIIKPVLK